VDAAPTRSRRSAPFTPAALALLVAVVVQCPSAATAQVAVPAGMHGGALVASGHTLPRGALAIGFYGGLTRDGITNRAVGVGSLAYGLSNVFQLSAAGSFTNAGTGSQATSFDGATPGYAVGPIALTARLPGPIERPFQISATAFLTPGVGSEPMTGHHHPWARDSFDLGFVLSQGLGLGTFQLRAIEGYVITGDKPVNIPSHLLLGGGLTWMVMPAIGVEGEVLSRLETEAPISIMEDYIGASGGFIFTLGQRLTGRGGFLLGRSETRSDGTSRAEEWGLYGQLSWTIGGTLAERQPRERRRPRPEPVETPETTAVDTDGDGVPDTDDLEPDTPAGARVNESGQALDADGDGVPDGIDLEEATPSGAMVDHTGRALDSDGDSVPDGIDVEPDTPRGAVVDAGGKAIDSDADGVPDGIDVEPDTPPGVPTDAEGHGLYGMEAELITRGLLTLNTIYFDYNSADLKPESFQTLREVGLILVKYRDLKIEIGGHTDSVGSDEYNRRLSRVRAESVLNWLLANVPDLTLAQFTVRGYGESQPVAGNDTEAGRTLNRRVEFKVLNTDQLDRYRAKPPPRL